MHTIVIGLLCLTPIIPFILPEVSASGRFTLILTIGALLYAVFGLIPFVTGLNQSKNIVRIALIKANPNGNINQLLAELSSGMPSIPILPTFSYIAYNTLVGIFGVSIDENIIDAIFKGAFGN
jgi:hypothetical protein